MKMTTPEFSSLTEFASDAIVCLDLNEKIISWNQSAEKLFARNKSEATGQSASLVFPPDFYFCVKPCIAAVIAGETVKPLEINLTSEQRITTSVSVGFSPVKAQRNQTIAVSLIIRELPHSQGLELKEREQQYQMFHNSAEFGFCICEILYDSQGKPRDYRYIEANRTFQALTGISESAISAQKSFLELFPESDISRIKIYDQVLQTEIPTKFEVFFKEINKWLEIFAFSLLHTSRNRIAVLVHDISKRKNVDEELRKSEERLKIAQKISHIGSWEYQYGTETTVWSEEMFRIYGLKENHIPLSWEELQTLIVANDIPKINMTVDSINSTGIPQEVEFTVKPFDKSRPKIVLLTGETEKDENGKVSRLYGTLQDITERKRAEQSILKNEKKLRELIDNLFYFVILMDKKGYILEINRTALNVSDLKFADVAGKHFAETSWWNWSEDIQENLRRTVEDAAVGKTSRYDVVIRLGDNNFTTIALQIAPLFDVNGKVINILFSAIDISERLDLEAKLMRTAQISLAGELAAGLAHEIKNPLTGMQGAIDLLLQKVRDAEEIESLKNVRHEIVRIDNIVHSLLDRTRPRMMCFALNPLDETIRHAVRIANHHLAARKIKDRVEIFLELPEKPCRIIHDMAQIEDAVLNLIINGVESIIDEGKIFVSLKYLKNEYDSEAVIEITDTGAGIETAQMKSLFTPFYTTKNNGTGLGLTSVKRVVDSHGGYCHVNSTVGKGTSFQIHLPDF